MVRETISLIEGAPVAAYWAVRKIVYSRFAFLMT